MSKNTLDKVGTSRGVNDPCNGGVALFLLRNEHNDTSKKAVLEDLINQCAAKKVKKSGGKSVKGKRQMSGYNCFMKECAKKTGDFQKCLTNRGWAKLSESEKENYNKKALEGCN